jgi:predicted TIM-barrel fold metal-dependent hydrolase
MQWAEVGGRTRLLVGGKVNHFIPNPLFDPVAKPGCLHDYFAGENPDGRDMRELFGELEPIRLEYRDRDARLAVMDEQGVEQTMMFPTLGVGMEQALVADTEACVAAFRAFNRWLDDDWGFAYHDRIYAAPYFTLVDVDAAVAELEWAIERGARVVNIRAAPVQTPMGPRSPADPMFDPFWARCAEAGLLLAAHASDTGYRVMADQWEPPADVAIFRPMPLRALLTAKRDIMDFCAVLICHGLFERFPSLRVISVENGAGWVDWFKKNLKKVYGQNPDMFSENPLDVFDRHFWVTPFFEDDIEEIVATLAADRITFGSDWPHAEGNARPLDYADTVAPLAPEAQRKILRDNAREALGI